MHGGRARHAVGRTFDQGFEGQSRVQTGAENWCTGLFIADRGHGDIHGLGCTGLHGRWRPYISTYNAFALSKR